MPYVKTMALSVEYQADSPHERPVGGHTATVGGLLECLVLSPGENDSGTIPVKSHSVLTRCQVKPTYKPMAKWKAQALGRGRHSQQPPL